MFREAVDCDALLWNGRNGDAHILHGNFMAALAWLQVTDSCTTKTAVPSATLSYSIQVALLYWKHSRDTVLISNLDFLEHVPALPRNTQQQLKPLKTSLDFFWLLRECQLRHPAQKCFVVLVANFPCTKGVLYPVIYCPRSFTSCRPCCADCVARSAMKKPTCGTYLSIVEPLTTKS